MNVVCRLLGHALRDTSNRLGRDRVERCDRCGRVFAGRDELLISDSSTRSNPWDPPR
jgi:hypothetical protein